MRAVVWFLGRVLGWRLRAHRPDVVPPPDQPLVVVFNHTSNVDAFLVAAAVWRHLGHWVRPLVKAELFEAAWIGFLVRQAGSIPVARSEDAGREAAYAAAVTQLRRGGTILIAPEGTTTHDGSLLPLRHGAARLALEAGVDVLVVTHFGAQRGFSPVVRFADRDAVVTMAMDVVTPWPDEDATSLTGRIAATMIDRSAELRESYPQADPDARWWPPYASPASPTATARENLERYRQSMTEAITQARERMARMAAEHDVEQRVAQARERAAGMAEEVAARSRERADALTEQGRDRMEDLAARSRERADALTEQGRDRMEELTAQLRERKIRWVERTSTDEPSGDQPDPPEQTDSDREPRDGTEQV